MTPPPPAEAVAAMIRPAPTPPDSKVNRDLLSVMEGTSLGYWLLVLIALGFMLLAGGIWVYQVYKGLGIAGYSHPVLFAVKLVCLRVLELFGNPEIHPSVEMRGTKPHLVRLNQREDLLVRNGTDGGNHRKLNLTRHKPLNEVTEL